MAMDGGPMWPRFTWPGLLLRRPESGGTVRRARGARHADMGDFSPIPPIALPCGVGLLFAAWARTNPAD